MKRIIAMVLALAVALTMVGCAKKVVTFDIDGASKILLMSGSSGEVVEITNEETIKYITDNINSMTFNRDESSRQHNGWSYSLRWYDSEDNLIEYIVIMNATRIDYDNYFYNEMDADVEIDIAYLEELLSGEPEVEDVENVVDDEADTEEPRFYEEEYFMYYYTFDEVIINSDVAIIGEYVETVSHDDYTEQKFIVKQVLFGDVPDEEIYLYSDLGYAYVEEIDYHYELGADIYTVGTDYILLMDKRDDRYTLLADIFLCEETGVYTLYSETIPVTDDISNYIISTYNDFQNLVEE